MHHHVFTLLTGVYRACKTPYLKRKRHDHVIYESMLLCNASCVLIYQNDT